MAEQEADRRKRRERDVGVSAALRQVAGQVVLDERRHQELRRHGEDGEDQERPQDEPPHRAQLRITCASARCRARFGALERATRLPPREESWLCRLRLIAEIWETGGRWPRALWGAATGAPSAWRARLASTAP